MPNIYMLKTVFLDFSWNLFSVKYYLSDDCLCQPQNLQKCDGHSFIAYHRLKIKLSVNLFSYNFQWLNAEPNFWDQLCMRFKRFLSFSKMQRYNVPHILFIRSILQVMSTQMSDLANNCIVNLMYNPVRTCVSEEGIKMTKTRQPFRKSFGLQRKQWISNKITFSHF